MANQPKIGQGFCAEAVSGKGWAKGIFNGVSRKYNGRLTIELIIQDNSGKPKMFYLDTANQWMPEGEYPDTIYWAKGVRASLGVSIGA